MQKQRAPFFRRALATALLGRALLACPAEGAAFSEPWSVTVEVRGVKNKALQGQICDALGEQLLSNAEGGAPFSRLVCDLAKPAAPRKTDWLISIAPKKAELKVTLSFLRAKNGAISQTIVVPSVDLNPKILKNFRTAAALASLIRDALPASGVVHGAALTRGRNGPPLTSLDESSATSGLAFTLTFDEEDGLWLPEVCGAYSPAGFRPVAGHACVPGQTIWFHHKGGPRSRLNELKDDFVATLP